ncbi:DUF421 domain-containing protein [Paenibacillus thermotolerans]|uniref:DUF421 domain-containing protein n=1 Tax=Paenibacillus thermotolerans TaxID=3027807 RepID=UPI002367DC47|nr:MULTISPECIES: DUF421 domain-containing protein [unclassified Paenibacillus]
MSWYELALRAFFAFLFLLLWAKLLGKKLISQMTLFDFVAGVTIGTIGGSIMFTKSISVAVGFIGLSVFCGLALLSDVLSLKSLRMRKWINSEPVLIIRNGQILESGLSKTRMTMNSLLLLLRKKNVFYVDEVELAFFEIDGSLSVLKKSDAQPVTRKDLQLFTPSRGMPRTVIIDGSVLPHNLMAAQKDMEWLKRQLDAQGISDVNGVALAQVDELGRLYIDARKDSAMH